MRSGQRDDAAREEVERPVLGRPDSTQETRWACGHREVLSAVYLMLLTRGWRPRRLGN